MPGIIECPGRIQVVRRSLEAHFAFLRPEPASEENLCLVHDQGQVARVKSRPLLFETVLLAVGGAIRCCELAMAGQPAFGLIRPPGHHADRSESWGFCYVNNMAVAIARLLAVADLFDAVTSDRPHRAALTMDVAFDLIEQAAGKTHDRSMIHVLETVVKNSLAAEKEGEKR
jgi:hypothetical protein